MPTAQSERVSVFVCGVQKSGTTSLFAHFQEHPQLADPIRKELHFFDDEERDWRAPDYTPLHACFESETGSRLRYDVTPIYSFWPPSFERIARYNPDARLIFLFRDPFERAWSHWCMEWARGSEDLPFASAIRDGRLRLDGLGETAPERRVFSYVERGFYAAQVERALRLFPPEQLLFLRSDDLRDDHARTLDRIADFLDIAPFSDTGRKLEHARPDVSYPSMPTEADRRLVADLVREDLTRFAALTGININDWPSMNISKPESASLIAGDGSRDRPNVLMIVADDLNSWIGALGCQPDVRTPAIDALARRGTLFARAYCAAPYCNASRMSTFTGCLPSTTGVYQNEQFWESPSRPSTYIEAFREAGYYTFGAGKVFHGVYDYATAGQTGARQAAWIPIEDRPQLWDRFETSASEPLPIARPSNGLFDFSDFSAVPPFYHHFDWGALTPDAEGSMPDEQMCRSVVEFLRDPPQQPFFCAAGIYKPHLPWHAPQRFFDLYDRDRLTLPMVRDDDLDDVPQIAREWALSPPDHELVTSRGVWRDAVQAYLAAISYCDWIVGRLVEALDQSGLAENTVIALWGDNGFHLGEKLHWRKFVLWEEATRVPLIIVPPRGRPSVPIFDTPVGLVDLFPTLADYCAVPTSGYRDGRSLLRGMADGVSRNLPPVTSWGRGNHSVRKDTWRYTRYVDGSEELYNRASDPNEWHNLAADCRFKGMIGQLKRFLPKDS